MITMVFKWKSGLLFIASRRNQYGILDAALHPGHDRATTTLRSEKSWVNSVNSYYVLRTEYGLRVNSNIVHG